MTTTEVPPYLTERTPPAVWPLFLVAGIIAIASLPLTGGDATLQIAGVVYLLILVVTLSRPTVGVVIVLASMLLSQMNSDIYSPVGGVDIRMVTLPFVAALGLQALARARVATATTRRIGWARHLLPATPLVVSAYGFVSINWSIDPSRTLSSAAALFSTAVFGLSVGAVVPRDTVLRILNGCTLVVLAASLLLFLAAPSSALLGERFRGVFANPNTLAAFLVVAAPVALARLKRLRWPAAAVLAAAMVLTGSRSGAAGLALELAVLLVAGSSRKVRFLAVAVLGGVGVWFLVRAMNEEGGYYATSSLLRSNNSRADTWAEGMRHFWEHPFLGTGFGALPPGSIAGIGPYLLATLGLVGTVIAAGMLFLLLGATFRASAMISALALGTLANNAFEPWIFAGGSAFCMIFWLVMAFHAPTTARHRSGRPGTWHPSAKGSPAGAHATRPGSIDRQRATPAHTG